MHHLANAHHMTGPSGLSFGRAGRDDRYNYCPLGRVLTYKNLIYLLNLQFVPHKVFQEGIVLCGT